MIDQLVEDLKRDEGWRSEPYRDSLGYLTIGYGFLIDERKPVRLQKRVGEFWLEREAERRFEELLDRIPWLIEQPQNVQRALGNMAYQMGVSGVLNFRLMLAALHQGDRQGAAEEAMDSIWASQTPERARRVADLIRGATNG